MNLRDLLEGSSARHLPYITDTGGEQDVVQDGKVIFKLGRYGVWTWDGGRQRHQCIDNGSDLEALKKKYDIPDAQVVKIGKGVSH